MDRPCTTGAERRSDTMLDAYVIEEIKRRERQRERDDRPVVQVPVPPPPDRRPDEKDDDGSDRGVVIIDYN
ncbi:MAG: hypothetical protein NDI82_11090 [Anaeromyxobacteraceae bacterium]|nr:hypothetical protein [Anaeromyxobacteraceae bacterium]